MTGEQFARALKRLKLSINGAAEILAVDRSSIIRWKAERRRVPGPVASYLKHLLSLQRTGNLAERES